MLRELRINNFALIDELAVPLGPGLVALTGETGAGKSIIIDALNAALGERIGADAIRGGAQTARVEAVFDLADAAAAASAARDVGLASADGLLTLSRTIAEGRSHYRINREGATLAALRDISEHLADIHGQHEHQQLIHEESHLRFLDAFGGDGHHELMTAWSEAWRELGEARAALAQLAVDERTRAQRLDLLRFQVEEIDAAGLSAGEDQELAVERERLRHSEKLREGTTEAWAALAGESDGEGALDALRTASATVEDLAEVDPALAPVTEALVLATDQADEAARALRDYVEALDADPGRIEQVEARLNLISGLRRKYGDTVEAILAHHQRAAVEVETLEGAEHSAEQLERQIAELTDRAGAEAERLSASRRELAERLARRVEEELRPLGMENARFEVQIEADADEQGLPDSEGRRWAADSTGTDRVRFLLGANVGEPLRPLSKVASGGELSRLMLAIKSIGAGGSQAPTLVFDEVDANIGGKTAHAVAEKLAAVASRAQVLVVTHLPQIACIADRQISVSKTVEGGRTVVRVRELDGEERVEEIARMMGQTETTKSARQHAVEMLEGAQQARRRIRGDDSART
ncbi:MAG TPA: DNA repair protein RecN [Armatimonadota bacterium]|nr:DNA repair protein RecN [Armatimonadota bacterium]